MYYIPFNYYTISLLIGAFTALLSGIVVMTNDRNRLENQAWCVLTLCTSIWSFGYFFMTVSQSHQIGFISNWILHFAAFYIPLFYYLLVLVITDRFKINKYLFIFFTVCALFFTFINFSPLFIADVAPKVGFNFAPVPGPLYVLFLFYFVIVVIVGLSTTAKAAYLTKDKTDKTRLIYTIIFTIAASVGGGSVFLTTFSTSIPPYLLILFSIYPAISGYAILRYQLFDTKIIATQLFIFILWIFIFIRTLLSESFKDQVTNSLLLLATILLGTLVIRSVTKEVSQRLKIEELAKDLEKANNHLKELDQLKSEFLSLASHQIRAPLTAIKGYISEIFEGDYGPVTKEIEQPLHVVYQSTENLVTIVNEFLDISRIEQGKMKYELSKFDFKKTVEEVSAALKPNIDRKGLTFTMEAQEGNYMVNADQGKIKQIIGNIIDNSIKYTPSGWMKAIVSINSSAKTVRLALQDSGVGISKETIAQLFQKFTRAQDASKVNIMGTGLGLYVAKLMMEAQNGKIWVESEGKGKGSTFFIELPLA